MSRGPYRRHAPQFKLQLCQDIRSGALGRRDAQKKYSLSANLLQTWLSQYDRGELNGEEVEACVLVDYEAKIAALERLVGRQALEIDLLKGALKHAPRPRSASTSVVTGPMASPPAGGAS